MTTRDGEEGPAERTAGAEAAPGRELSSRPATGGDAQETAPLTGSIAAPPDDARQLELEIERTREQLAETVQELAARADVKARARAKATEVSGRLKGTMVQARSNAAARAAGVRSQVAGNTATARQRATSAGKAGRDQLRVRVVAVSTPAWEAMPEQVRKAATKGASGARERWIPLSLAAEAIIAGGVAVRLWKMRPSGAVR